MRMFWLFIFLFILVFAAWGDLYIYSRASLYAPYEAQGINLESLVKWDNYLKIDQRWSLFYILEILQDYDYFYDPDGIKASAKLDLSYREDLSLNLISIEARGFFYDLQSIPDREIDVKFLFSRPLGDIYIQWEPGSSFYFEKAELADLKSSVSLSLSPGNSMILQPAINVNWRLYHEYSPDFLLNISSELSHYLNSDLSFFYSLNYFKNYSDNYTLLSIDNNEYLFEVSNSYDKLQGGLGLSWYSPHFRINTKLIAAMEWQNYMAIAGSQLTNEKEWSIKLLPDVELILGIFDPLLFSFFFESAFGFSNSDYLNYQECKIGLEASMLL
ncbi:MAG: hypothetical protein JXR70_12150 [Spirochaetales bacterium]|nr:hypothetical protein [Spirochaetales bacterium]